jgi:hypothetical protein
LQNPWFLLAEIVIQSYFIQKRAVIAVSGADSRVSWALMGEQRKERSTSLPNNELAIQVRPVNVYKRFYQFPKLPAAAKVTLPSKNKSGQFDKAHIAGSMMTIKLRMIGKRKNLFIYDFFNDPFEIFLYIKENVPNFLLV